MNTRTVSLSNLIGADVIAFDHQSGLFSKRIKIAINKQVSVICHLSPIDDTSFMYLRTSGLFINEVELLFGSFNLYFQPDPISQVLAACSTDQMYLGEPQAYSDIANRVREDASGISSMVYEVMLSEFKDFLNSDDHALTLEETGHRFEKVYMYESKKTRVHMLSIFVDGQLDIKHKNVYLDSSVNVLAQGSSQVQALLRRYNDDLSIFGKKVALNEESKPIRPNVHLAPAVKRVNGVSNVQVVHGRGYTSKITVSFEYNNKKYYVEMPNASAKDWYPQSIELFGQRSSNWVRLNTAKVKSNNRTGLDETLRGLIESI